MDRNIILYIAIELSKTMLGVFIQRSEHRNILVAGQFIESLTIKYRKHPVYSDGNTWYPEACKVLGLKHCLHTSYEKSVIEQVNF